jgi:hypothetical protein
MADWCAGLGVLIGVLWLLFCGVLVLPEWWLDADFGLFCGFDYG